jgi:hypothetical protein
VSPDILRRKPPDGGFYGLTGKSGNQLFILNIFLNNFISAAGFLWYKIFRQYKLRHTAEKYAGGLMNGFNKFLVAAFMSAAMLLPNMVQAMEIRQYDKMASQDRNAYVASLVIGAQKVLIDEGRSDLAAQVNNLFTEKLAGDDVPLGIVEFNKNLAQMRVNDATHAAEHPNDPRLEVEDAMAETLHKNHIELPDSFFTVNSGFKPQFPSADAPTPSPPQ